MPKILERLTMWASRWRERCGRKARVACTTPQKLMFISQSICAWSISLNWPSSATPALLTTMLRPGWLDVAARANASIWLGSDTSTRWVVTFRMGFGDFGGDSLQSRLVAIGQRQVAAARRELKRQRPADTTGRAGDGGGGSTDRSHLMPAPWGWEFEKASDLCGKPRSVRQSLYRALALATGRGAPAGAASSIAVAMILAIDAAFIAAQIVDCIRTVGRRNGGRRAGDREFCLPGRQDEFDRPSQPSGGRRAAAGAGAD